VNKNICTSSQMKEYLYDLVSHMIESLYKAPESVQIDLINNGKIRNWLLKGASLQLRSKTSPFYIRYRKHKMYAREQGLEGSDKNIFERPVEEYDEGLYECFREQYDNLHFYQRAIMDKFWIEGMSLTEVHKYYNISKNHLVKDINKVLNQIRQACQHC